MPGNPNKGPKPKPSSGFDSVIYFGDSLTDTGNLIDWADDQVSGTTIELPEPYAPTAFTTSLSYDPSLTTYASYLPGLLDLSGETRNYAVAGADAVGSQQASSLLAGYGATGFPDTFDINLGAQVDRFLADLPNGNLGSYAASLFIGLNDYADFEADSNVWNYLFGSGDFGVGDYVDDVVAAITEQAARLADAGVGTLIVNLLPPIDFFPLSNSLGIVEYSVVGITLFEIDTLEVARDMIELNNTELVKSLDSAAALKNVDIKYVDFGVIADQIMTDKGTFGFIAPLDAYRITDFYVSGDAFQTVLNGNLDGLDPDQYAFVDQVHFTTSTQGIFAAYSECSLNGDIVVNQGGIVGEEVFGTAGNDTIFGGDRKQLIYGNDGDDTIFGGLGFDVIEGGNGNDLISGGTGEDYLWGDAGDDIIAGGSKDDFIRGGDGNDALIDGLGSDQVYGDNGDDIFFYTEASLIGGTTGEDIDILDGGSRRKDTDTVYIALPPETLALIAADVGMTADALQAGPLDGTDTDLTAAVETRLGLTLVDIEEVYFLDGSDDASPRMELAAAANDTGYAEADLWGFV